MARLPKLIIYYLQENLPSERYVANRVDQLFATAQMNQFTNPTIIEFYRPEICKGMRLLPEYLPEYLNI